MKRAGPLAWLILFTVLFTCSERTALAQLAPPDPVDPKSFTSSSGRFTLVVDPQERYGGGDAMYSLRRKGVEVWSGKRPFTLREAEIAEDGTAGGYAYTDTYWRERSGDRPDRFHVVILAPDGAVRLDRSVSLIPSLFMHVGPDPTALGLVLDGAGDRLIVRLRDPDLNRQCESWCIYQLSTGKELGRFEPRTLMPDAKFDRSVIAARPVAGTPLTLLHWWHYGDRNNERGARFTLITPGGSPVWSLTLPNDYSIPGDHDAEESLLDRIWEDGAILRTDRAGQFEVQFVAARRCVTFGITRGEDDEWKVREVARRRHDLKPESPEPAPPRARVRHLKPLGRVLLRSAADLAVPPIRNIQGYTFAGPGRIAVLREGSYDPAALVVTNSGGERRELLLDDLEQTPDSNWSGMAWVGADRFFLTRSPISGEGAASGWWIDLAARRITRATRFKCPPIRRIVGLRDGGFVVLGSLPVMARYNASGKRTWALYAEDATTGNLGAAADLAVLSDDSLAVLDQRDGCVKLFTPEGRFKRAISLEQAWGRKPHFANDLSADRNGGMIVGDFDGEHPFVRMRADGSIAGQLRPRTPELRTFEPARVEIGSDNHLWTSDGQSLFRLDETGMIDLTLGERKEPDHLLFPTDFMVGADGSFYLTDWGTSTVHAFAPDGRPKALLRLNKDDSVERSLGTSFPSTGRRGDYYAHPLANRYWVSEGSAVALRLADGRTLRHFERRHDRTWIRGIVALSVAPDGSAATVEHDYGSGRSIISLYGPDGDPVNSVVIPGEPGWSANLAYENGLLLVAGKSTLLAADTSGRILWRFPFPGKHPPRDGWKPYITNSGKDLLLYDGARSVYRYALPARQREAGSG